MAEKQLNKPATRSNAALISEELLSRICCQQAEVILAKIQPSLDKVEKLLNEVAEVKTTSNTHSKKISLLESKYDDLEQYSRRANVRLFGIPEESGENLFTIMTTLFQMRMGINGFKMEDIDRVHRIGTSKQDKPRPVLLKFVSHRSKVLVLKNRKSLKGSGINIKEDLTKVRYALYQMAVKKFGATHTWTMDGKIHVTLGKNHYVFSKNTDFPVELPQRDDFSAVQGGSVK